MAALDTFADLMQALDENPQLGEVLAARILPREVLELPQQVAELAAGMKQHAQANKEQFAALDQKVEGYQQANREQISALDQKVEKYQQANKEQISALDQKVEKYQQANKEQFAALNQQVAANAQQISDLDQKVEKYQQSNNARFDAQDRRMDEHQQSNDRHFWRIEDTLKYLKASHARNSALRSAATLARRMGLRRIRNLTEDDLLDMTYDADTSDLSDNVLDSFHLADLVMETTDADGETHYIAVEISFTADERDTGRAIRNAALLTRFTGKSARAAVAGIYQDNRIQPQIDSGEVFWHRLRRDELEVE